MKKQRKSKLAYKLHQMDCVALLFSRIQGRNSISLKNMVKGIAANRGLSTRWVFTKSRYNEKKSVYWTRRQTFQDFLEQNR